MMVKKKREKKKRGIYIGSWRFLKECKVYFLVVIILLLVSSLVGYVYPKFFSEEILDFIKKLMEQTADMNFWQLLVFILENNIMTAFVGMITGILLGLFPILTAVMNGYVLGFVMNMTAEEAGASVLLRLLPHGIFELPALIISLGLGIRIGMFVFAKHKKKDLKYVLENSLRIFLFIIIPLLLIAGVIETGLIFLLG